MFALFPPRLHPHLSIFANEPTDLPPQSDPNHRSLQSLDILPQTLLAWFRPGDPARRGMSTLSSSGRRRAERELLNAMAGRGAATTPDLSSESPLNSPLLGVGEAGDRSRGMARSASPGLALSAEDLTCLSGRNRSVSPARAKKSSKVSVSGIRGSPSQSQEQSPSRA